MKLTEPARSFLQWCQGRKGTFTLADLPETMFGADERAVHKLLGRLLLCDIITVAFKRGPVLHFCTCKEALAQALLTEVLPAATGGHQELVGRSLVLGKNHGKTLLTAPSVFDLGSLGLLHKATFKR